MKFHKTSKIEKMVSKDPTKRILENPWLDVDRGVIMSSPEQSAVIIPVKVEHGDVSGPVPVECLKEIRKNDASLQCTEDYCIMPNGAAYPRARFTQYPAVEQLMATDQETVEISLNAKSLLELAQSMGTDVVKIRAVVTGSPYPAVSEAAPLIVTPHPSVGHVDGAIGALLPYRVARV